MEAKIDVKALWEKVVDQVKLKTKLPTLWRSLEIAVPIAAEDNQFVIGFAPGNFHMSGHLLSSEHKNAIETTLIELSGIPFSLRIVEGDTIQDWQSAKLKDARMQVIKEDARAKRAQESAITKSWDSLLETVGRRYAALPLRQFPQARAKYLIEMLKAISETMDDLMPSGSPVDEVSERSLARIIDKVGALTETAPTLIALELERYRRTRQ